MLPDSVPQDALPDAMRPAPRNTLPLDLWAGIFIVFFLLLLTGGRMGTALWSLVAPENYAAHTLNDYDLSNKAGREARFVPVLLARAQGGDKSAMFFMGDLYDPTIFQCETTVPKNAATAIAWYDRAVPLDDQGAERALGILYYQGVGLPRDDAMAASLFEKAVLHNDDIGDYYLGVMLENGQSEAQNVARAVQLEQASAAQGNDMGETELGRMYMQGIGLGQDSNMAAHYWRQAAAQGDRKAKADLTQYGMQ